jgi:hypothetical protein
MNPNLLKIYDIEKDILGEPQEYKGIKFHPIKLLGELKYKNLLYSLFFYPKNTVPDKTILKMSYLKFILIIMQAWTNPGGIEKKDELECFLKHICRTDKIQILFDDVESLTSIDDIKFRIKINDIDIFEYDFENLREIILEQNGSSIEYVNQYDPGLEESLNFVNREHNDITFEENIFIFCSMSGIPITQLKDYTLYQFKKHNTRLSLWENYKMFKSTEILNPGKDGKGWVKDYLTHINDKDRYGSILIKKNEFVEQTGKYFQ